MVVTTSQRRAGLVSVGMVVFLCMTATAARAQIANIGLNPSTPGARAGSMGRTFIGIADDASASITNPAGLFSLSRPQVYAEFSSARIESDFSSGERTSGLSFFGLSAPIGGRTAVAFSRHEFFRFKDFGDQFLGVSYAGSVSVSAGPDLQVGVTISADTVTVPGTSSHTSIGAVIGGLWHPTDTLKVGLVGAIGSKHGDDIGFNNPNRLGGGVGFRPTSRVLVAADLVWIQSSKMLPFSGILDDTVETHAGLEFQAVTGDTALFLRAGAFTSSGDSFFEIQSVPSKSAAIGVGVSGRGRYQVDFGFLTANREIRLSAAFRF